MRYQRRLRRRETAMAQAMALPKSHVELWDSAPATLQPHPLLSVV